MHARVRAHSCMHTCVCVRERESERESEGERVRECECSSQEKLEKLSKQNVFQLLESFEI